MYTRCPECYTLFRISEQQLSAAKGKVRCGQCDNIYNAQGTLLDSLPDDQSTPAPPVKKARPATAALDNDEIKKIIDNLSSADALKENKLKADKIKADKIRADKIKADKTKAAPSIASQQDNGDDWEMFDLSSHDDVINEDEINLSHTTHTADKDDWFDGEYERTHPQADSKAEKDPNDLMHHVSDYMDDDISDELTSDGTASSVFDEVNAQLDFSTELTDENKPTSKSVLDLPGDWLDDSNDLIGIDEVISSMIDDEQQELNDEIISAPPEAPALLKTDEAEQNPFISNELEEDIVLESGAHSIGQHDTSLPVMTDAVPLRLRDSIGIEAILPRSPSSWLMVVSTILILVAILITQFVLFRSTQLANAYPEWQPFLIKTCEKLPCRDSNQQDVTQIQLMSRNVSQHPKVKTALLIKASIKNGATFAQRYPNIQITLSDLSGNIVAQRTFQPETYLGSLYHPFLQMKPGKPVHIALQVLDPSNTAINFEFKFL